MKPIKVIDIFAGPGGLGEGFSSFIDENENPLFKIALSIEKEKFAYDTLLLRSFYRQFKKSEVPEDYYKHLRGEISREELFSQHSDEFASASEEAWQAELGQTSEETIDNRIRLALKGTSKWLLIGGPPCQAYSVVGRARTGGLKESDPRVYLFKEYYRILAVHNPPLFIMENVKGLLSSKIESESIFHGIVRDLADPVAAYKKLRGKKSLILECPGYSIFSIVKSPRQNQLELFADTKFKSSDFIIKSENYGIPQSRHRVILLGIRNDISIDKVPLLEPQAIVILKDVISGLPPIRSKLSKDEDSKETWKSTLIGFKKSVKEVVEDEDVRKRICEVLDRLKIPRKNYGNEFLKHNTYTNYAPKWYLDERIGGVVNHSARGHIELDLFRYLFLACYAEVYKHSAKLENLPRELLPKHLNALRALKDGIFNDRFRVQLPFRPATTITSHISKDGHYYIHPDPSQCRSLTVREAARIQTFPDNYFFSGPRTAQYVQVGNAVPPLLARMIAEIIFETFFQAAGLM